jgi:hypothetical protein
VWIDATTRRMSGHCRWMRAIRTLELAAGAEPRKGQRRTAGGNRNKTIRDAERALARQAESAYRQTIADWKASEPAKTGASVTPGRASQRPSKGKAARQITSPLTSALRFRQSPAPTRTLAEEPPHDQPT